MNLEIKCQAKIKSETFVCMCARHVSMYVCMYVCNPVTVSLPGRYEPRVGTANVSDRASRRLEEDEQGLRDWLIPRWTFHLFSSRNRHSSYLKAKSKVSAREHANFVERWNQACHRLGSRLIIVIRPKIFQGGDILEPR